MKRALSAVLTLCMALPGASVAFGSASAATVSDDSSTSASSTAAGSLVEDDGFTWDNANVYFLLTDRFKNGNTANDHSYGRTLDKDGKPLDGWDTNPGTFHGGDFAGVTQSIEEGYFDNLGVNAIWISAPYEQTHGYCDSGKGFAHYSYHGYYVLDYTETDANFGTKEEFKTLVDTAHEHGIRVIMDIVMNHTGYNTVADMEQFGFGTLLDGALDFKYKLTDVGEVNDHIDYKTSEEDWGKWWSNDWIRSGLPGYTEGAGGDLTMSLSGLPDFRTEQTKKVTIPPILKTKWTQEGTYDQKVAKYGESNTVTGYLSTWLSEWVREYGVDGFRCDMAEMVPVEFWEWAIPQVKEQYPSLLFIAEVYNPGEYKNYLFRGKFDYLYDKVGLYDTLRAVTCGYESATAITRSWQSLGGIEKRMLNFLENHDEQRIASDFFASNPRKAIPALIVSACMNTNPMMIYFGQEFGELGMDSEGFSGRDGRTTIFDYWSVDTIRRWRNGGKFDGKMLTEDQKHLYSIYKRLLTLCNEEKAISQGAFFDLMYANVNGWRFNEHKQYTFLRKFERDLLLFVVNFDHISADLAINIPSHAFDFLQIPQMDQYKATELLSGKEENISLLPYKATNVAVEGYGGKILKIKL